METTTVGGIEYELHEPECGECGSVMVLRFTRKYNRVFYGCGTFPTCRGTHGAHQRTGAPLGVPADQDTKRWRMNAHAAFDQLWRRRWMTRRQAYQWMQRELKLTHGEAHIGKFDVSRCMKLIHAVRKLEKEHAGREQTELELGDTEFKNPPRGIRRELLRFSKESPKGG